MAGRFRRVLVDPATNFIHTGWRGVQHVDLKGMLGLKEMLQSKPRLVKKDGSLNIKFRQLEFSNPLSLDNCIYMNWFTIIWLLVIGFLTCWLGFAFVYFIVEYFAGNVCTLSPTDGCFRDVEDIEKSRCVTGLYDFNSALQFSIESMTTIGYGSRALNSGVTRCYVVIITVMAQYMAGLVLATILTGIIIVKFKHTAPNQKIVSFSPKACIAKRPNNDNKHLTLVVSSQRKIFDATIEAFMIQEYTTKEGFVIKNYMQSVPFSMSSKSSDVSDKFVHVMWPVQISHEINQDSPFYKIGHKKDENLPQFELLVLFQGTTSTGATINVRSSYVESDIVFGGRFNVSSGFHQRPSKHISVDISRIFEIEECDDDDESMDNNDGERRLEMKDTGTV